MLFCVKNTLSSLNQFKREIKYKLENSIKVFDKNNGPLSFLSLAEKMGLNISSKSLLKLDSKMHNSNTDKIDSKRKKRFTQDGRSCAQAFVQDGKTYFDCTSSRSPDGKLLNKEWCYVDASQRGMKDWDYCKPIMDYDKVREANLVEMKQITIECQKVNAEISQNIGPAQNALDELKRVKEGQADLDNKINLMLKKIQNFNNNLVNLYNTKTQWENMEKLVKELEFNIDQKNERAKEEANEENMQVSDDDNSQGKVSGFIQKRKNIVEKNCDGMLLYEDEDQGEGLIGKYFDNEMWLGSYIERRDEDINFDWTGSSPIKGININNFSISWEGYIFAPYTGTYYFAIECDDGASIEINGQTIISHNMGSALENSLPSSSNIVDKSKSNINPNKSVSKEIKLNGGTKFKIVIKYFHSIHDDLVEDGQAFIKFTWFSDEFTEKIVSQKYLYTKNIYPPLKVTGFNNEEAIVRKLYEHDPAFKNSDKYILQDIPIQFHGTSVMKFNTRLDKEMITFHINTPSIIYIAFLEHYPNPLKSDFEDTGLKMSLLQLDKVTNKTSKKLFAKKSSPLLIYKKKFSLGLVKIPLNFIGLNKKGVPLVLFFGYDPKSKSPVACSGDEKNVSLSSSKFFKECYASSESSDFKCEHAFNGKLRDQEGAMWASNNEGIGAWIIIKFKKEIQLSRFEYKDRKNPAERNSKIELGFSNGEVQLFRLKNTDEIHNIRLESVKTHFVKVTIKEVYGTINNGGAFNFYGVECNDNHNKDLFLPINGKSYGQKIKPMFESRGRTITYVNCKESLSNSHKFDQVDTSPGSKIVIKCPESCSNTEAPVYGNIYYTKDSALCKAAFHSKKLPALGGKITLVFSPPINNYKGILSNTIKSEGKKTSEFSISFEDYKNEDEIIVRPGTKIDLASPEGNGWIPGVILSIEEKNEKLKYLKIIREDKNVDPIILSFPNKDKIQACGEHLKERDCKGSRTIVSKPRPIKIRFVPKNYNNVGDFIPDTGHVYGEDDKPYGWTKDMSSRIRLRNNPSKPELETLVEFPPSPLSKYCNKPSPDTLCETVSWIAKVGKGKFIIRIYVGDPNSRIRVDLKINDKIVAQNKIVEKNTMEIIEDIIDANKKFIVITSECSKDCKMAVTKINALEIVRYESKKKKLEDRTKEIALNCGNAFKGGRCDYGPNVIHCLFDDPSKKSSQYCNGEMTLIAIPSNYKCKDQYGKFKCVYKKYYSPSDCKKYCPQECKGHECLY